MSYTRKRTIQTLVGKKKQAGCFSAGHFAGHIGVRLEKVPQYDSEIETVRRLGLEQDCASCVPAWIIPVSTDLVRWRGPRARQGPN